VPASLDADRPTLAVELDYAIAPGIAHRVGVDDGAFGQCRRSPKLGRQAVTEKHVVAEDQAYRFAANELAADDERIGQPARLGLHGELELQAPLPAVAQEPAEGVQISGVLITRISRIPASINIDSG
jgi:hypothetical protein